MTPKRMVNMESKAESFVREKKALIDTAFDQLPEGPKKLADLGGVWDVDGMYTFYALDNYPVERAVLVDTDISEKTRKKAEKHDSITLIAGNFGDELVARAVGDVDLVLLFDVLLHQVKPDWRDILEIYGKQARGIAVFNPQYIAADSSVRLLDLGRDEYFENVPHSPDHPQYSDLFDKMDEIHPQHNRPWRDIHNIWQWGVTNRDMIAHMESLGFTAQYEKNCGRFHQLKNFESHAFLFIKNG
jgi:hypothetical protein